MTRKKIFLLGMFLTIAPFLFCFLSGRTLAPTGSLLATNLPYSADQNYAAPDNHFWADTVNFYWPRFLAIARHEFPISYSGGGGSPNFADTISGFFSPFCLLAFGLLPTTLHSLDIFWLLQFSVYFSGMFFWLSVLGISPLAALLGALSQSYCTAFFAGSYMSFQTLGALVFLPWAMWADEKFARSRHRFWLPAVFLALSILAGNVQTAIYPLFIYGVWGLICRRFRQTIYSGLLAILFSMPMWTTGFQYHVLLGIHRLANRRSQVPADILGRIRALLALPAILLPDLYGSSKSIDFLKAFKTSATYFIGSIGLIGPLLCLIAWRRECLKRREIQLVLSLLFLTLLFILSPLLNFLYYRILCVICFALSVFLASCFDDLFIDTKFKKSLFLLYSGLFIFVLAGVSFFVKRNYHAQLEEFFLVRLSEGAYAWNVALVGTRVERWFNSYLSDWHFLSLMPLLFLAYYSLRAKMRRLLAIVIFSELLLLWLSQVTFNPVVDPSHPSFTLIKKELEASPSYPASRFLPITCDYKSEFLFPFSLHEYQGIPSIYCYGSTMIARLPNPQARCDLPTHTISFDKTTNLQNSALNIFATHSDWSIADPEYRIIFQNQKYKIWARKPFSAIWSVEPAEAQIQVQTKSWDSWHLVWSANLDKTVSTWSLSLPYYPGWHYTLDNREIKPSSIVETVPSFREELTPGAHTVIATFTPTMLYWGFLGSLIGLLIALWKSISTRD